MLIRLHIEQYALIDRLTLSLDKGMTVITGETGAGKSILMGALSLILGQRADVKVIQEGKTRCLVEAEFDISDRHLAPFFDQHDLEYSADTCLVRREIYENGKSRAFVNDSPVTLGILKDLTLQLIDIHSQHQNLLIGTNKFQLEILDALVGDPVMVANHVSAYQHFKGLQTALATLNEALAKSKAEEDYLRFQLDQLNTANLVAGEMETLEAEWSLLSHAEEIQQGLGNLFNLMDTEDSGLITRLRQAHVQADSLKRHYPRMAEFEERLLTAYIDLKDLSADLEVLLNDVEVNPARLEQVGERLNLLNELQKKHRVNHPDELLSLRDALKADLEAIEHADDNRVALEKALLEAEKEAIRTANLLTEARRRVGAPLSQRLRNMLKQLGIPNAQFDIVLTTQPLGPTGADAVRFHFSANKNVPLQPLEDMASGGEMSRIMLCLKSIMAEHLQLSTLVFDEIDTGVSGEIAYRMGEIMREIASNRQVICITHLPQIAALGQHHFKVRKTETKAANQTTVTPLNPEDRLMEIAQLLSGANVTEAAILNARHLLADNHP